MLRSHNWVVVGLIGVVLLALTGTASADDDEDRPGVVGTVGGILGEAAVNIAGMQVARDAKGGHALVALSVDSAIPADVLTAIQTAIDASFVRAVSLD